MVATQQLAPLRQQQQRRVRCWLVSSKPIAAGAEILAKYAWRGNKSGSK